MVLVQELEILKLDLTILNYATCIIICLIDVKKKPLNCLELLGKQMLNCIIILLPPSNVCLITSLSEMLQKRETKRLLFYLFLFCPSSITLITF